MILEPLAKIGAGMLKEPTTIQFPEEGESKPDTYRGIHKLDMNTCINCQACARICPNQTIVMVEADTETAFHNDAGPKLFPDINLERCLFCALCEEVCPTNCLVLGKRTDFEAYDRRDLDMRPEELV